MNELRIIIRYMHYKYLIVEYNKGIVVEKKVVFIPKI